MPNWTRDDGTSDFNPTCCNKPHFTKAEYRSLRSAVADAHYWKGAAPPDDWASFDITKKQRLTALKRFAPCKASR